MVDHAPLQWLSTQRWKASSVAGLWQMQEHTFDTVYRKGTENTNADFLSHNPVSDSWVFAITSTQSITADILRAQLNDLVIKQIYDTLSNSQIYKWYGDTTHFQEVSTDLAATIYCGWCGGPQIQAWVISTLYYSATVTGLLTQVNNLSLT